MSSLRTMSIIGALACAAWAAPAVAADHVNCGGIQLYLDEDANWGNSASVYYYNLGFWHDGYIKVKPNYGPIRSVRFIGDERLGYGAEYFIGGIEHCSPQRNAAIDIYSISPSGERKFVRRQECTCN